MKDSNKSSSCALKKYLNDKCGFFTSWQCLDSKPNKKSQAVKDPPCTKCISVVSSKADLSTITQSQTRIEETLSLRESRSEFTEMTDAVSTNMEVTSQNDEFLPQDKQTPDSIKRKRKKTRKLICEICGFRYKYASKLIVHLATHIGQRVLFCKVCRLLFADSSQIIVHLDTHIGENEHFCKVCSIHLPNIHDIIDHMTMHIGETVYSFTNYYASVAKLNLKVKYVLKEHKEKLFSCILCNASFWKQEDLIEHVEIHEEISFFPEDGNCVLEKQLGLLNESENISVAANAMQNRSFNGNIGQKEKLLHSYFGLKSGDVLETGLEESRRNDPQKEDLGDYFVSTLQEEVPSTSGLSNQQPSPSLDSSFDESEIENYSCVNIYLLRKFGFSVFGNGGSFHTIRK